MSEVWLLFAENEYGVPPTLLGAYGSAQAAEKELEGRVQKEMRDWTNKPYDEVKLDYFIERWTIG